MRDRRDRARRRAEWAEMIGGIEGRLERLLQSDVYGRGVVERKAAPITHGAYLFTEGGRHLYVGRTGKTERSLRAGKPSASGFRARLAGHCRPSSGLSSATFAIRLALEQARKEGKPITAPRRELLADPRFAALFIAAKERITAMEFRVVEIEDDRESAVFEVYAAYMLETRTTHSQRAEHGADTGWSPRSSRGVRDGPPLQRGPWLDHRIGPRKDARVATADTRGASQRRQRTRRTSPPTRAGTRFPSPQGGQPASASRQRTDSPPVPSVGTPTAAG